MGFPVTAVLGASGRIGRLLRQGWQAQAAQLRWQARRPAYARAAQENTCPPTTYPPRTWHILDPLQSPQDLAAFAGGAEVLLCLAGVVPGRGGDLKDNIDLALATIEAAAAEGGTAAPPRVLLSSSAAVYGNQAGVLKEDRPLCPANAYGEAKAEMEQRAQARGRELGVAVTALRIGNIAGLDAILGGWHPGFRLDHFADGQSPRRSYLGGQALARLLADLLPLPQLPAALNLAQPGPVAMADLLRAAGRVYEAVPAPEGAIPEVALDLKQLQQLLPDHPDLAHPADPARLVAECTASEPVFIAADPS